MTGNDRRLVGHSVRGRTRSSAEECDLVTGQHAATESFRMPTLEHPVYAYSDGVNGRLIPQSNRERKEEVAAWPRGGRLRRGAWRHALIEPQKEPHHVVRARPGIPK